IGLTVVFGFGQTAFSHPNGSGNDNGANSNDNNDKDFFSFRIGRGGTYENASTLECLAPGCVDTYAMAVQSSTAVTIRATGPLDDQICISSLSTAGGPAVGTPACSPPTGRTAAVTTAVLKPGT